MQAKENPESIDRYKSWVQSFPVGHRIYRGSVGYTVLSAGMDFLILQPADQGPVIRVSRNTLESIDYTARAQG